MTAPSPGRRGGRGTLAAAAVALAVAGTSAVVAGLDASAGPPQPAAAHAATPPAAVAAVPSPRPGTTGTATSAGAPEAVGLAAPSLVRSRPVRLEIPSIGVASTSIVELGKQADGSIEVPSDFATPGWYTPGPAPGQFGPAVLAGHVDSKRGPAVFYRLGALRPGADVVVARADGSLAHFVVDQVRSYPKDQFPTDAVYGDTTHRAELRLITCGGAFDRPTGHYVDNTVAFAHLV